MYNNINMYIKDIQLTNYRNYENETFCLTKGLNVIYGENAGGKTNLVESVLLASIGKSFRSNKDKDLIKWDSDKAHINIVLVKKYREYIIDIYITDKGTKTFFLNKVPITKIADLMGIINVVFFSPDELAIIKDAPSERRRYIDIAISQQKKSYFTDLIAYNRVLDQRNKVLKTYSSMKSIKEIIPIWDIQLAQIGARIINNRYIFTDNIKKNAGNIHSSLTDNKEILTVDYDTKISRASPPIMEQQFIKLLQDNIDKDIKLSFTSIGPHRDDLSVCVNGIDMRKFGSQGQQRTCALSLKLTEIAILEQERGEEPILILDDVLSELDESRRRVLLNMSRGMQTLLTTTHKTDGADNYIYICGGKRIE